MKKLLSALSLLFIGANVYASVIFAQNVEIEIPDDWVYSSKSSSSLLMVAGVPVKGEVIVGNMRFDPFYEFPPDVLYPDFYTRSLLTYRIYERMEFKVFMQIYKVPIQNNNLKEYVEKEIMPLKADPNKETAIVRIVDDYASIRYRQTQQIEYLYIRNGFLYALVFASSVETFDGYIKLFNDIKKTLKIK
jgi:hypothetical protein